MASELQPAAMPDHKMETRFDGASGTGLRSDRLKQLALESGADDAGLVEIERRELDPQRDEIMRHYPWTRTLLSFVVRMTREPIRSPARSVANLEFHHAGDRVDAVARTIVRRLEDAGIRAVNPSMGFPMEMEQFPDGATWVVSHKPVAVAAGLGHLGIHRNLIHPRFGNFVLLGTVLIDAQVEAHDRPLGQNPCLGCRLCVAACPVGAIAADGRFNFSACYTHNYREFMGGFTDWVEQLADSSSVTDYRRRIGIADTAAMWQSLSFGANYKSAYCLAVCPAGEEVMGRYLADRKRHLREIVKPLQEKPEPLYVVKGSDAEAFARGRWPHKTIRYVGNALRPRSVEALLNLMPVAFQPHQSQGLNATFHFTFTGEERRKATVTIANQTIRVDDGHLGRAQMRVTADSRTWLRFLDKERSLLRALVSGRIRFRGSPRLLRAFGRCFPSPDLRHAPLAYLPPASRMTAYAIPYRQNDAATGRIRWYGSLRVDAIIDTADGVKTFRLVDPAGGEIPFRFLPGQFLILEAAPDAVPIRRPYTIASSPSRRDHIEITVKREPHGIVSGWLHDHLKVGDSLRLLAPNGRFVFTGEEAPSIALIGAGVGVTPLMSVARWLTDQQWSGAIHMILGFHGPGDILFRDELAELRSRNPALHVTVTLSDPAGHAWSGATGRIDKALLQVALPRPASHAVHLCGPAPMMASVGSVLTELGVPAERIRTEAFGTDRRDPGARRERWGGASGRITFRNSARTVPACEEMSVLDAAEAADIHIDNACRSGSCGLCRVKLLSGRVRMAVDDALTADDRADGYILACQAEAVTDLVIES